MLDNRRTFSIIFGILFVLCMASTALAQQEQQPDSALSESQVIKIIEAIHESENRMREYVDKKFGELDKKIDGLDDRFDELSEDVAFINGQLTIIKWGITIFGAPLLVGLIIYFVQNRKQKANVTADVAAKVAAENRDESDEDFIQRSLRDNQPSESELA